MEELKLGQHDGEEAVQCPCLTIVFYACAGDAASDRRARARTARDGEEAVHV
jgi:hypothetical protein